MASNTRWTPDKNGKEHPGDGILLAYVRQQQLDDRPAISQHIEIDRCPRCRHRCNELAEVSATLDVLGQMAQYQSYPELSTASIYTHVQKAASKSNPLQAYLHRASNRERPRKSAVRLVSLPIALGLALLCAMLVLARLTVIPLLPGSFLGHTSPGQNNVPPVPVQLSTPTPDLTATAKANASLTPTPSPAPQANLQVCSTPADIAQSHLVICGYNFVPGHKISLIVNVAGKQPVTRRPVTVDQQGKFQDKWYIYNCRNVPAGIFAFDTTTMNAYPFTLVSISFGACPVPTLPPIAANS